MRSSLNSLLVLFITLLFAHVCKAQDTKTFRYEHSSEPVLIGESTYTYLDETNSLTIDDVTSKEFTKSEVQIPNFDVTESTVWLKFSISNTTGVENLLLEVENPLLNEVVFYQKDGEKYIGKTISKDNVFDERNNGSQNYQFEIPKLMEKATYYLSIKSNAQMIVPVKVGSKDAVLSDKLNRDILSGIYFGIMFVMFFYNIIVYISTKDRSYLYYIIYILTVALMQLNITGLGFKYLWPNSPWFENISLYIFNSFTAFASIAFIRYFLHTKQYTPRLHKGFIIFIVGYIITMVVAFFGNKHVGYNLLNANALPLSLYMIGVAAYIRVKYKHRQALFFLVAWSVFLVSIILFVMKDFGALPYNLLTVSILQIGSAFVVILLSIALADNINTLRKEKETSQEQALTALAENARIVREQNIMLETKVNERTVELKKSNDELNKTLVELKEAETQLVESEKMASLGQLTAGIAHEINNPINFVTSNVKPLKRDIDMLVELLEQVEEIGLDNSVDVEGKKEKISSLKEDLDFDYLKSEVDFLLNGINEGSTRTAEIVKGLRVFSRLDEDDLKKADINEGLDSTLVIVNNLIGTSIEIEKNYGDIPMIECFPGKLNQVFLNMITNGLQAIKSRYEEQSGGIFTITTTRDEGNIYVSLKDNGIGMDENTQKKIFEPFFTTKDVGEGTGLGMSIVYNTINKHNGKIELNSALGEGTEFVITLPIVHKENIEEVGQ